MEAKSSVEVGRKKQVGPIADSWSFAWKHVVGGILDSSAGA